MILVRKRYMEPIWIYYKDRPYARIAPGFIEPNGPATFECTNVRVIIRHTMQVPDEDRYLLRQLIERHRKDLIDRLVGESRKKFMKWYGKAIFQYKIV